ncbi:hypothetical protein ACOMHN_006947 [Nucella lapillus]
MSAVFLMAVATVMAGFALQPPLLSSAYPTTTITTTTTTTASPDEWEVEVASSGPVPSGMGCFQLNCDRQLVSGKFMALLQNSDFNGLANVIDTMCDTDLPAVERCFQEKGFSLSSCAPVLPGLAALQFFCRPAIKAAVKAGRSCWNRDFREGMRQCVMEFSHHWGQNVDHCQAVATLKMCAHTMMDNIPACFSEDMHLIEVYVRVNTLLLCHNQ